MDAGSLTDLAWDQDELLRLIASLCEGAVSNEGLDREGIARLGGFIEDYLTRRAALHHFFFGEPKAKHIRDQPVAQAELARIRTILGKDDETEDDVEDDDEADT